MDDLAVLGGLFGIAFLAATILPAQSEAALAGLILTGAYPVATLVLVASAGNILGSSVNWALGRGIVHFRDRRWFPFRQPRPRHALVCALRQMEPAAQLGAIRRRPAHRRRRRATGAALELPCDRRDCQDRALCGARRGRAALDITVPEADAARV